MGNTLCNSLEIPVFPAGMGNTHISRDFDNPEFRAHLKVPRVSYEEEITAISRYRRDTTVVPTLNQRIKVFCL